MARYRDDDDDFDDEDYEPRPRRREAAAGRRYPLILFGGLAIGAIVVTGMFIFVIRSARNAVERATEQVAREQQAALAQVKRNQERPRPGPPEPNWPKLVGTWSREPAGKEDRDYPYRFEFRENKTCTTTRVNFDGHPTQQESSVQVIADQNDLVRLALIVPAGRYVYSFLLKPDGTLVLDEKGGLVFTRAK